MIIQIIKQTMTYIYDSADWSSNMWSLQISASITAYNLLYMIHHYSYQLI